MDGAIGEIGFAADTDNRGDRPLIPCPEEFPDHGVMRCFASSGGDENEVSVGGEIFQIEGVRPLDLSVTEDA